MTVCLALLGTAFAGNASVGVIGARDQATDQWWSGLDLALNPSQDHGIAAFGRIQGGYGFTDGPLGAIEVGATGVVPNEQALIRFGGLVRSGAIYAEYPGAVRPFGVGSKGDPAFGLLPGAELLVEFEWGDVAPFTLRIAGGTGSEAAMEQCEPTDTTYDCVSWSPGILFGISARGRLKNGLYGEAVLGPSPSVALGYGFPIRKR
jgi:hypothetical protein